ncbi:MAG: tRNA pseudouridine(38-40) synthase TruA [Chthoniobacterales bacterium]|nr:tRNA pseudouridine(38-40) synthase TruA [Chthoniobacterales bacterium]
MPNDKRAPQKKRARRVRLIVAYEGTGFAGWQSQARGDTVQDRLEAAFLQVTGEQIRVHGAGRTDAGVHALGQCAHVDLPPSRLTPTVLTAALNASLPARIRILRCGFVAKTFHARFDAQGKVYRYRIATSPVFSPFELGRAWHVSGVLDDKVLRASAHAFLGRHNFVGFAANRGHPVESTIRTLRRVRVQRATSVTTIEFDGDGFLYKMVRLMVGAIVRAALGKTTLAEIRAHLADGTPAEPRLVAPAAGLTLVRVRY